MRILNNKLNNNKQKSNMKKLNKGQLAATSKRLNKLFAQVTQDDKTAGSNWYGEANDIAQDLASKYNISIETVAKVIAVLSPNVNWSLNIDIAQKLLHHYFSGREASTLTISGYPKNKLKAYDILSGSRDLERKGAPKTYSFYRNIMLDDSTCTIDIWHLRACFGKGAPESLGDSIAYRQIESLTRKHATKHGLTVRDYQAIIWVTIRSSWSYETNDIDLRTTEEILSY